jgi:nitroimidazol reductase NimA-like FMN-containing flavoprotein (pyridoxamine 5'-phosphate oxidase superfamily)
MGMERFELQAWECDSLLRSQQVGRMCIIDHGYPLALPVNYRPVGPEPSTPLVIRTAPDTLIGRYEGPASLEVDVIDEAARTAWSVIVRGALRHVTGTDLPDPEPWFTVGRHHWMLLAPVSMTGRRFIGIPNPDGSGVEWSAAPS